MVAAAILGGDAPLHSENAPSLPTGRLRSDLRELIDMNLQYLAEPANQAALPALLSEIRTNEKVRQRFARREEEWTATIRSVLARAVESGDAPQQVLGRELLLARVLAGATYSLQFAPVRGESDIAADDLTGFLLAALLAP
jgi:hypothetical protein